MSIGDTISALLNEVVAALVAADIPDVADVHRSLTAESLIYRDSEGQLPAIGVRYLGHDPQESLSAGYAGLRRQRVTVRMEVAIAVQDESDDAVRLDRAVAIWGYVWDTLCGLRTSVPGALVAYSCGPGGDVNAPRLDMTVFAQQVSIDITTT